MDTNMDYREEMCRIFNKYAGMMKARSLKWYSNGGGKTAERKIEKFIRYFVLPIKREETVSFLDTTILKTAREGILITFSGILVKEPLEKLYYLKYGEMEGAEVRDVINEDGWRKGSELYVRFRDGKERKLFDGYVKKEFFAEFVNETLALREGRSGSGQQPD